MRSKFNAKRTEVDGIWFDSHKESRRYEDLKILERVGEVCEIELQPKFAIILNGAMICTYKADFRYRTKSGIVIEDVKGVRTPVYKLKKKLVEAQYGIKIIEV